MKNLVQRLFHDDSGQSTTEYILILSVVVMIAMKFKTTFEGKLNTLLEKLGRQVESASDLQ